VSPTLTIIFTYFAYNLLFLAVASSIGLAGVIAIHRYTHTTQGFTAFTLFLYAIAAGITTLITILFVLALSGWLVKVFMFSAIAATVSAACIYTAMNGHFFRHYVKHPYDDSTRNTLYYFSLGGTVLIALFSILTNIHPTGFSDGTSYHLPYAQYYLDHSGLATNINLRFPYHSHNANLLYSLALSYADSIYCQTLHALFGVLTALVVFALALAAGVAAPFAMLAAASFLALDIFRNLSSIAVVDLFAAYFVAMSVYGLCMWRNHQNDKVAFIISALCLAMAMGTKYLEALYALPIAVFIIYQARSLRPLFIYASIAALFGLWWYVRSFLATGNPVHPFAAGIFGYSLWNEADMAEQLLDLNGFMEKSFINFVSLPRLFNQEQFAFTGMQYWLYGFYLAPLFWTRLSSCSRALMLLCWPFLTFWFFTSQAWRYIAPLAPLMIVICFDLLQIICNQLWGFIRRLNTTWLNLASLQPMITGLLIAFILHRSTLLVDQLNQAGNRALTPFAQEVYLKKYNREYELVVVANQYFSQEQNIYLFTFFDKTYFAKAHVFGEHFGQYRARDFSALVMAVSDPGHADPKALQTLRDKFASLHLDGFIMDNNIAYDRALFDREFELLYRNQVGAVYRIKQ
jgi:hypothetical protein